MKIKNLFSTGKMNKDIDERLIPSGEFIDGYNIRVLNTSGSDAGAIENEKGNVKVTSLGLGNNPECIGSVSDEGDERIYWFVVNDLGYSYVFEHDVKKAITSTVLADERDTDEQILKFNKDYKITGVNVVYNPAKKSKLLLFTDGLNQPRMVDIERAKAFGKNNFYEDDISLYKKPPRKAPVVVPFNTANSTENAVRENFFSFGYRYRYLDGGYSAPSSFTYFKFFPGESDVDFASMVNEGMQNIFNGYKITYDSGDKRVTDVQLLFKFPTEPNLYVVESINKKEKSILDDRDYTYEFTNKKIYKTLPADEVNRIYDDIPLTAKSQEFIGDRLIFGNTTSQYDLTDEEESKEKININFSAEVVSAEYTGEPFVIEISEDLITCEFDGSGLELKKGRSITFGIDLFSETEGVEPETYGGGKLEIVVGIVFSQNYQNIKKFTESADFIELLDALNGFFKNNVETVFKPNLPIIREEYGEFSLESSATTTNTFTLRAPVLTAVYDGDPDPEVVTEETEDEQFKFTVAAATLKESSSSLSLKSNRSYEVGMCYLDGYGRYSSVLLPSKNFGEKGTEVFCPPSGSTKLNSLQLTVRHQPPYWADRYKFFVKQNKGPHFNIYGTVFYEDGVYRWVLLEGANIGKVEKGMTLFVKRDGDGIMDREVKCKVLDVTTKGAQDFVPPDFEGDQEGWIAGNIDATNGNIIERSGLYMKIRPLGFVMDFVEDNYVNYYNRDHRPMWPSKGGMDRVMTINLPGNENKKTEYGILQKQKPGDLGDWDDDGYYDIDLLPDTSIAFEIDYHESKLFGEEKAFKFVKKYIVQKEYQNNTETNRNALEQWFEAETNFVRSVVDDFGSGNVNAVQYIVPKNEGTKEKHFTLTFYQKTITGDRWYLHVKPNERKNKAQTGDLSMKINIILSNDLVIFETDPDEIDNDIFYETEETFEISNGVHLGNVSNQSLPYIPAVCKLGFGNCFSFGDGIEGVRILDDRFKKALDIQTRPNIALIEGYEKREDTNKLVFSGSFNENTGYNSLNEFNASRGITKFLDLKYGSIQKLFARDTDLIVFQEDRVSKVLYGKNLLSSPDGSGSLTQIEQVLGQDVAFAGEYGISRHPESFSNFQGRMYFTDAHRGTVLRLGGDGLEPISYQGMKSFFKENLFANKNSFNIGGFDPKYHQYVLTIGADERPADPLVVDCAAEIRRKISSAFEYDVNLGVYPGKALIDYETDSEISISVLYNGETTTETGLTGTGTVEVPVSTGDLAASSLMDVTVTPATTATVTLTHTCPQPDTMEIVLIVRNDPAEADNTIINRFKHLGVGGNNWDSDLDVFKYSGNTRYETITGPMGSDLIPAQLDDLVMSSYKILADHTGTFTDCNKMGYMWESDTLSAEEVGTRLNDFTYPEIQTETTDDTQESTITFEVNRETKDLKLYLLWDYVDDIPALTDDQVIGIENGSSQVIDVLANDTVPSNYIVEIETPPSNGTAIVNDAQDNITITYQHTDGASLSDNFQYRVSSKNAEGIASDVCTDVATVTTQALNINENTFIYIYFDASGSMDRTGVKLNEMVANSLKETIQPLYASNPESTDSALNGSDLYDSRVKVMYSDDANKEWGLSNTNTDHNRANERTFLALSDVDVNFMVTATNTGPWTKTALPADSNGDPIPESIIIIVFQDEAQASSSEVHDGYTPGNSWTINSAKTDTFVQDINHLRSQTLNRNETNTGFYRGGIIQVKNDNNEGTYFKNLIKAVENGTGVYGDGYNLSDMKVGTSQPYFAFRYDVEDEDQQGDANAPLKPGSSTDRFNKWEYYYLYHLTGILNDLGFTPPGETWPKIKDDN
jgi:hypothetical protein